MVRAAQKGEMENPSPEVSKVAATASMSDVKKFASTKHKGLPEKKKMKESFTIDKKAHRTAQKFAKIRTLAKKGATEGERAAAEKKSKGPKMFGEDMSGMSQKSGDKRSTESGAGMTAQGVAKYNRRTGGNLKTAVTTPPSKLKPGSKAANRRKSFCARSKGWTGERGKAARRRWNCSFEPEHGEMISEWDNQSAAEKIRRHAKADEDTAKKKVEAKYGRKTVARSGKNWKQFKKDVESAKDRLRPGEVRRFDKEKGKWVSNKD